MDVLTGIEYLLSSVLLMVWDVRTVGYSYKMAIHHKEKTDRERDSKCQLAKAPSLYSDMGNRWREVSAVLSDTVGEPDQR